MRRKYWNALRSSCATPSPSAYMRPSFHCASGCPCSAAYSSEWIALAVSPALSHLAPERNASIADNGAADAIAASEDFEPSKATAGAARSPAPITIPARRDLAVRIALRLRRRAGMRHRPVTRLTDLLGVFPQRAGTEMCLARLPLGLALGELLGADVAVDRALVGVDGDDVAVAQKPDRTADRRFRADMADAEPARRAGETAIGDERDLVAHALAIERRGRREHLAHAGAAARSLIADDENLAFLVGLLAHGLEAGFLAVEAA